MDFVLRKKSLVDAIDVMERQLAEATRSSCDYESFLESYAKFVGMVDVMDALGFECVMDGSGSIQLNAR